MSKDIRSYFIKVNGSSLNKNKTTEEKQSTAKKRVYNVESDSDEDFISNKPTPKKQKESQSPKKEKKSVTKTDNVKEKRKEVIKVINPETFFGKTPIQQKAQVKANSTEKKRNEKTEHAEKSAKSDKSKDKSSKSKKKSRTQEGRKERESAPADDISFDIDDGFDDNFLQLDEEEFNTLATPVKVPEEKVVINKTPGKPVKSEQSSTTPKEEKSDKTPVRGKDERHQVKSEQLPSASKEEKSTFITPVKEVKPVQNKTPGNSEKKALPDSDQKKKNSESYFRYMNRSGPKNPGSKRIPKGNPTCLVGKAFVISGVLESMEREEAAELIQKCGGRVTSAVSKKTNYIVLGEEAGASKLEKANKFGTVKLTEDELLDLIRTKSGETIECDSSQDNFIEESPLKKEGNSSFFKNDFTKKQKHEGSSEGCRKKLKVESASDAPNKKPQESSPVSKDSSGIGSSASESQSQSQSESQSQLQSRDTVKDVGSSNMPEINFGDTLWVDKYKPKSTKNIIGQAGDKSNVKKLTKWLQNWHKNHSQNSGKKARPAPWVQNDDGSFYKAALLSGPPGVGKTTSVHLICKELGLDIVEFNASDTRSKRFLHDQIAELLSHKSIRGYFNGIEEVSIKQVLVMDEVDGMAGNEDRGGVQELIQLIKNTKVPIVCMCNDRSHPKMRSLVNYCYDLRYSKPRLEQIKAAMMSICFKEGIKVPNDTLVEMITNSHHDVRQVLHNLSLWAVRDNSSSSPGKIDATQMKKPLNLGPWDVTRRLFSKQEREKMSQRDKEDLFFQDYSLGPLFVQDTYVRVKPSKANNDKKRTLDCLARAADSISKGDIVEKAIRSQNAWTLLPVQGIFSTVVPGFEMEGYVAHQIQFPTWLGKNSKRNKCDRLLQEIQAHMRLSISGSKEAVNLDYLEKVKYSLIRPLSQDGMEGVQQSLKLLMDYNLTREDVDSIDELTQWPGTKDSFSSVDSKVKAALTRAYNKEGKATPYAISVAVKKSTGKAESDLGYEEEAGEEENENEKDNDNVESDAMIKAVKQKASKSEKLKSEKSKSTKEPSTSKGKRATKTGRKGK